MNERILHAVELAVLAATLIVTIVVGWAVYCQTLHHFELQRSTSFLERFNSEQLIDARAATDAWLRDGESAEKLYAAAEAGAEDVTRNRRGMQRLYEDLDLLAQRMRDLQERIR